ncbi:ABC transporter substrate-binding protein [Streptomyces sp. NEAU-S77]|uniref:ABC transporter substrate-binding protein n=1 Tax=Streptomyces sp. NEAU-S77 TaxID=3411033 RepID=UPI003BA0F522
MRGPSPHLTRRTLLGGGLALGTTACAGHRAAAVRTSGPVNLSLWTHDEGYETFFRTGIPGADRRTDFRYRLDVTRAGAADLVTKLLAQAVAGRGIPDLMGFEINGFPRMLRGDIAERLLRDLTGGISAVPGLMADLLPARTAPYRQDGRLYALDSDTPLVVHYYRHDLFARYRLPLDIATWEEFAEVGALAHRRHGIALNAVVTGSDVNQVVQSFQMLLNQRGGALFDAEQRLTLDSPEAVEVLEFLCRGLRDGFVIDIGDYYGGAMQAALKRGTVAGLAMASWYKVYGLMAGVPEQSGRWRIRPLPRFSRGGHATSTAGGTGFGVLRGTANERAAVDFLRATWLTHEGQVRRFRRTGYLPTRRSVFEDPALLRTEDAYLGGQRPFDVYTALLADVPPVHMSPDQSILHDVLSGHLLRAYRGDASPREALREAAEDFRDQAGR